MSDDEFERALFLSRNEIEDQAENQEIKGPLYSQFFQPNDRL